MKFIPYYETQFEEVIMAISYLNTLAQYYVNLTLNKARYDEWDVYWNTDRPYWRKETFDYWRDYKIYPYIKLDDRAEGLTLQQIYDESDHLISGLKEYRLSAFSYEFERIDYLIDHTINLKTRCAVLLGHKITFDEMTEGCYNLVAPEFDYSKIDLLLDEINQAIPGQKSVPEKIIEWEQKLTLPREGVAQVISYASTFFHNCAVNNMPCPKDDMPRIRFRDLGGKKEFLTILFGYDYDRVIYERNFALDFPWVVDKIIEMIGHEMEPGHLTFFHARLQEAIDELKPEMQIIAQYSPSSAFSEGAARMATYMCFDNNMDTLVEYERENIFKLGHLDLGLVELMPLWHKYRVLSNYVKLEVTRNRWDKKWSSEEAGIYLEKYGICKKGLGKTICDNLAGDDGHFVAHDYARDVVIDYFKTFTSSTKEQWDLYYKLCHSNMSMKGIADKTYSVSI